MSRKGDGLLFGFQVAAEKNPACSLYTILSRASEVAALKRGHPLEGWGQEAHHYLYLFLLSCLPPRPPAAANERGSASALQRTGRIGCSTDVFSNRAKTPGTFSFFRPVFLIVWCDALLWAFSTHRLVSPQPLLPYPIPRFRKRVSPSRVGCQFLVEKKSVTVPV